MVHHLEETPRSFAELCADAADVTERTAAIAGAGVLGFQVERLSRQVAEIAQRLAGDTETMPAERDGISPDLMPPKPVARAGDTFDRSDADALDRLAEFVRLPNWQVRGSGADWIECVAEIVSSRRDTEIPPADAFRAEWDDDYEIPPDLVHVRIPGIMHATYNVDDEEITDLTFSPAGADAGYRGAAAELTEPRELGSPVDVRDPAGPFWSAMSTWLADDDDDAPRIGWEG